MFLCFHNLSPHFCDPSNHNHIVNVCWLHLPKIRFMISFSSHWTGVTKPSISINVLKTMSANIWEKASRQNHQWPFFLINWTMVIFDWFCWFCKLWRHNCCIRPISSALKALKVREITCGRYEIEPSGKRETVWACYRGRYYCLEFSWMQIDIYYQY